jgi:hypothetical protein
MESKHVSVSGDPGCFLMSRDGIRAVTHNDVSEEGCRVALDAVQTLLGDQKQAASSEQVSASRASDVFTNGMYH